MGWLGAVIAFLGFAAVGLASDDEDTVRGAYLVMEPAARFVLVPLAFATVVTGVLQSLITVWGLLRHYWVLFKLLIAVVSTAILLIYLETFSSMAAVAADENAELAAVRNPSPLIHAALAIALLVTAIVLAVFKPRGLTAYGRRKRRER
ncbi:MAG: hypothetical protein WD689_03130 [Gaiellaceae bacterium]